MAYEIVITRPCVDAPGRFIAESAFGRRFNMSKLCELITPIAGAKCSESLGVAKFDYKEKTLILYRSGRVDLRKIENAEDARTAMKDLEAMLGDAFEA